MKIYVLVIVCLWTILGLLTTIDEATKPPLVKNQKSLNLTIIMFISGVIAIVPVGVDLQHQVIRNDD